MNHALNKSRGVLVSLQAITACVLSACCAPPLVPEVEFADTITHAGTYGDLSLGRYDGFMTVSNVLRYGDHGLGTFDALNGEMIVYSGVVYRAHVDGVIAPASPSETTPFAVVTFFSPDRIFDIPDANQERVQRLLDVRRPAQVPEAIQVEGVFRNLKIRSVPAQTKPYPALEQVVAQGTQIWTLTNASGVLVGYYYPPDWSSIHPPGYHFHYLSSDGATGGHVLEFHVAQARIMIDASPSLMVLLSSNRPVDKTFFPAGRVKPRVPATKDVSTVEP